MGTPTSHQCGYQGDSIYTALNPIYPIKIHNQVGNPAPGVAGVGVGARAPEAVLYPVLIWYARKAWACAALLADLTCVLAILCLLLLDNPGGATVWYCVVEYGKTKVAVTIGGIPLGLIILILLVI